MAILNKLGITGRVKACFSSPKRESGLEKPECDRLVITFDGIEGDCHASRNRLSDSRMLSQYKRGTPVAPGSSDEFDKCIDPADETVILGSKVRFGFDRIGIRIAPYNAGPYAEGAYEVTLPVTPAVIAAVRPEFRASFAPGQ